MIKTIFAVFLWGMLCMGAKIDINSPEALIGVAIILGGWVAHKDD